MIFGIVQESGPPDNCELIPIFCHNFVNVPFHEVVVESREKELINLFVFCSGNEYIEPVFPLHFAELISGDFFHEAVEADNVRIGIEYKNNRLCHIE